MEGEIVKRLGLFFFVCCLLLLVIILQFPNQKLLSLLNKDADSDSGVLTIYSPLNESIIIPIIKEFQETTGIQVEYLSAGTMELLKLLDTKEDEYLMDVIWGGSREYLEIYTDLFEPYVTSYDNEIEDSYKHTEDYFSGFNLLPIVLMYNTKLVTPEEVPKLWMDLLDPKWKGKIAFADPNNSGSAFLALSFLLQLNNTGSGYNWKNAESFIGNLDGKVLAKSSETYESVANGDFAMGITMEDAAIQYIHKGADVNIVYLMEGTPIITDSIALMKDVKNKEEAEIFIDFVLSEKVQTYMADYFYLRSIRTDIAVPEGVLPMEDINTYDVKYLDTYAKKTYVLNIWKELIIMNQ